MKLTPEIKAEIDAKSIEELLSGWRFAPIGSKMFQDETGEYWSKRIAELRDKDNMAYVAASKSLSR